MPSPSLDVNGRAVWGVVPPVEIVSFDRSSFLGRWRAAGNSGEPGSFLTMILGGPPVFRELITGQIIVSFKQSLLWKRFRCMLLTCLVVTALKSKERFSPDYGENRLPSADVAGLLGEDPLRLKSFQICRHRS